MQIFFTDSGSPYTIVDVQLYNSIPKNERPKLEQIDMKLKSTNGEYLTVHGQAKLKLRIGSQYFEKKVKVVRLGDKSAILGLNFMEKDNCIFFIAKGK